MVALTVDLLAKLLVRDWEGKIRVLEGVIAGLQIEAAERYKDCLATGRRPRPGKDAIGLRTGELRVG